ncbi:MAG: 3-hydroxyacyl-CoA dehydrogenase family protein [Candidatus Aminicenantes bacterium]|nr:3-hydroxyacyl-CoA dehydrogenase family protein [Candidatus Aminicenantes bacterium]
MKIGIAGYGKMGRSAFNLFAAAGFEVAILVRTAEQASRFQAQYERRVARRLRHNIPGAAPPSATGRACRFSTDPAVLSGCALILENLPENAGLKRDVLKRIEAAAAPDTVIATNTSSLSVAELAAGLSRSERFCGFHLIHPIPLTSVVEIISWEGGAEWAVETARDIARRLNRRPIVVRDCPGPALNPVLGSCLCEALYILEQGLATPRDIDRLAERAFRVGPCESLDIVGIPLFRDIFERTAAIRPPCFPLPALIPRLLADGRTGREGGRGLYLYDEEPPGQSPLAYYRDPGQNHSPGPAAAGGPGLLDRLLLIVQAAALYILKLDKASPDDLDLGLQDALGLAEGPIAGMRRLGRDEIRRRLERFNREVGPRYNPELAEHLR